MAVITQEQAKELTFDELLTGFRQSAKNEGCSAIYREGDDFGEDTKNSDLLEAEIRKRFAEAWKEKMMMPRMPRWSGSGHRLSEFAEGVRDYHKIAEGGSNE